MKKIITGCIVGAIFIAGLAISGLLNRRQQEVCLLSFEEFSKTSNIKWTWRQPRKVITSDLEGLLKACENDMKTCHLSGRFYNLIGSDDTHQLYFVFEVHDHLDELLVYSTDAKKQKILNKVFIPTN